MQLRLSYAGYKTTNKVTRVPFATLERRLEQLTPKQSAYALLMLDGLPVEHNKSGSNLGISMDDKGISDALRMPPPPSQSLYTTLLQDVEPHAVEARFVDSRSVKRPKKGLQVPSHAGAPDPSGFSRFQPATSSQAPSHSSQSPNKRLYSSTQKRSTASSEAGKRKKKSSGSLPMADREQLAAKTLASLLVANGSPRSPVKPKSTTSKRTKPQRPHRSSVSSIDAAMADVALAISLGGDTDDAASRRGSTAGLGDRYSGKDMKGSGMDTAPASPVLSAAQRERDSAELLLLLATSPSPARTARNPTQRPAGAIGQGEGRVLFPEANSSSSTSGAAGGRGSGSTSIATSLLLPAPPSPTKKSSSSSLGKAKLQGHEERFTAPPHPSLGISFQPPAPSVLQPPFTPGASGPSNSSPLPGTQSTPFGTGFTLGLSSVAPSTPAGFNMADYINFTPTPGGFSPAQNPKNGKGRSSVGIGTQPAGPTTSAASGLNFNLISPPGAPQSDRRVGEGRSSADISFMESRRVGYVTGTDTRRSDEANPNVSRSPNNSATDMK